MTSQKKIDANRANGRKGKGPRNPSHSRLNATKHNLFSRELRLSPEEQAEFAAIKAALREDLHPHGFVLEQACDDLAVIYWRLHLATRIEQQHVTVILDSQAAQGKPDAPSPEQRSRREALAVLDAMEAAR